MSQILDVVTWLTICQLLILTWVLLRPVGRRQASHKFLAAFFMVNVVLMAFFYALRHTLFPISAYGFFAVWSSFFLLAPLLYFYVLAKCEPNFSWRPVMALHFSPMLLAMVGCGLEYTWRVQQAGGRAAWVGRFGEVLTALLHLLIAAYLVVIFLKISRQHVVMKQRYSNLAQVDLAWLTVLIAVFVVHWLFDVADFALRFVDGTSIAVHQLMGIFAIGILGIFALVTVVKSLKHPDPVAGEPNGNQTGKADQAFAFEATRERLEEWMKNHRPYLNPELSLDLLASEFGASAKHLSQCINTSIQQNFFDFINSYRLKEAKHLLMNNPEKTISEIMYEAGFNSKATFNRIFKKQTGLTPTQYRNGTGQRSKASIPSEISKSA